MEQVKFKNVAHLYLKVWGIVTGAENKEENGEWILTAQRLENFLRNQLKFKPILRRLDSMTEEECYELEMLGHELVLNSVGSNEFYAERTHYLLSKHFDLFGLIESGEAIDANQSPINQ